ncbi:MAG: lipoyl(octanoyl) transferase LipB [Thermoplasmataceae archaeon]
MDYPFTSNLAVDLGRIEYSSCLDLQRFLVGEVRSGRIPGILLFLEHPPVYTIGRKADPENYPMVEVVKTDRGGDVTYHGPGQLVIYPILRIAEGDHVDVRAFVHKIEDIMIDSLKAYGYSASVGDEPGIWIHEEGTSRKVASIGMAIDHGISYHGIAINLSPDAISGFERIRPCGLNPDVMGYVNVPRDRIINTITANFSLRFGPFRVIKQDELPSAQQ